MTARADGVHVGRLRVPLVAATTSCLITSAGGVLLVLNWQSLLKGFNLALDGMA